MRFCSSRSSGGQWDGLATPVCFLDCRPLLSWVEWYPCPHGIFQSEVFLAALRPRCPPGYDVGLIHRGVVLAPILPRIPITDRETLTFTFYEAFPPVRGNAGPGDSPPGPPGHQGDDHAPHDRPPDPRRPTGGTITITDAGTGSTITADTGSQPPGQQSQAPVARDIEAHMWRTGHLPQDAAAAGPLPLTPASSIPVSRPARPAPHSVPACALLLLQEAALCCLLCNPSWMPLFWAAGLALMNFGRLSQVSLGFGAGIVLLCSLHSVVGVQAVQLQPIHNVPCLTAIQSGAGLLTGPPAHASAGDTETGRLFPTAETMQAHTVCSVRRLPTPCRNADGLPRVTTLPAPEVPLTDHAPCPLYGTGPWPELQDTVTLLEEAACASDEWAFLAATLLDTLLEFYGGPLPPRRPYQGIPGRETV